MFIVIKYIANLKIIYLFLFVNLLNVLLKYILYTL